MIVKNHTHVHAHGFPKLKVYNISYIIGIYNGILYGSLDGLN